MVMFLLGLVYVAAIGVAVALAPKGLLAILIIVIGGFFFAQWFLSDKITLFSMNAKIVQPEDNEYARRLHGVLDRLCALADMPKPRVGLVDTEAPNAFAAGRSQKNTVICATTGLMRKLPDDRQLEAVLAHELSHVAHKDVVVMTIASFLGILSGLITRITFEMGLWGGFSDRGRDDDESPAAVLFFVMIVSGLTYLLSFLLIRGLSRYRELAADRSGALLTGNPSAMIAALTEITGDLGRIPTQDLRKQQAFNAFFFAPAIKGASVSNLFATHPTLQVRQEKLAQLAVEIGR
ncbi:peptidase M48 Ste24p [Catenulispora acidiphila DSM 44928]|uniref:Peptidase M48 Ste24p n=2 Tax=Catenulispora TaxID=414878 RepID=C7QE90_CATAD|nr:peptidase M48 Ste24p [Catenulispora acidiphila DSM 44928]